MTNKQIYRHLLLQALDNESTQQVVAEAIFAKHLQLEEIYPDNRTREQQEKFDLLDILLTISEISYIADRDFDQFAPVNMAWDKSSTHDVEDNTWTDPAGGVHHDTDDEFEDPAKMYE